MQFRFKSGLTSHFGWVGCEVGVGGVGGKLEKTLGCTVCCKTFTNEKVWSTIYASTQEKGRCAKCNKDFSHKNILAFCSSL